MRIRGIWLLLLVCFALGGLAAGAAGVKPRKMKVGLVVDVAGLGDKSFNDSAYLGLLESEKRLKVLGDVAQPATKAEEEAHIKAFASGGYDLVIGVGFAMKDAIEAAADRYPRTNFAIIDAVVDRPNVASLLFREHEGSFLVGAAAAMVTKTRKLGFVGGMEIPLIKKFEHGFRDGATYVDGSIEVFVKYTGSDPSAWNDPVKGRELTLGLIGSGADVIFQAAGGTGMGVIKAVKERGVLGIGCDRDQDSDAPGTILTSMIKRCNIAVFQTVSDVKEGKFRSGLHEFGLAQGGVGTSDFRHTKALLPADGFARLDAIAEKIKKGEIHVFDAMAGK